MLCADEEEDGGGDRFFIAPSLRLSLSSSPTPAARESLAGGGNRGRQGREHGRARTEEEKGGGGR